MKENRFTPTKRFCIMLTILISLSSAFNLNAQSTGAGDQTHAQFGFGKTIQDAEIIQLMKQHSVAPKAVFLWVSGISGTHRVDENKTPEQFLRDARSHYIRFFENGLKGNQLRVQRFIDNHSAADINADAAVQTLARSLLTIRKQLENALLSVRGNRPVFFAVEAQGHTAAIASLRSAEKVKVSSILDGYSRGDVHKMKPKKYQLDYTDLTIQSAQATGLYTQLKQSIATRTQGVTQ